MDTLFIADIHLGAARPEKLNLFQQLLAGPARRAGAMYILGDLFDRFWLGNDDVTPPHPEILAALRDFAAHGPPLYILRGNRELMLDQGIERLTGATLLTDPARIALNGKPVLVTHGDRLCTRDVGYQRYRKFLESRPTRWLFPRLPYALRNWLVDILQPAIKLSASAKPPAIMDVDDNTVVQTMRSHAVLELIHGHTHRPGIHELVIDNQPARRIVLGDWYDRELILVCRDGARELLSVQDYLRRCSG